MNYDYGGWGYFFIFAAYNLDMKKTDKHNGEVRVIPQYVGAFGPIRKPRKCKDIEPAPNVRSNFLMISWIWAIFGIPAAYVLGVYCGPEAQDALNVIGSLGIYMLPIAIYRERKINQSK